MHFVIAVISLLFRLLLHVLGPFVLKSVCFRILFRINTIVVHSSLTIRYLAASIAM